MAISIILLLDVLPLPGLFPAIKAEAAEPSPVMLDDTVSSRELGGCIEYMDDGDNLTVDDIRSGRGGERFRMSSSLNPSLGYSRNPVWVRFRISNRENHPVSWYLEHSYPIMDRITLYYPDREEGGEITMGDVLPFDQRVMPYRNFIFPVTTPPGEHAYYLKLQTRGSIVIPLTMWSPGAFSKKRETERTVYGLVYGFLLAFFFFHLIQAFGIRERFHLYLSFLIMAIVLYSMVHEGLAYQYLWPSHPRWANMAHPLMIFIAVTSTLLFTRRFLGTFIHFPVLDRVIVGLSSLSMAFVPVTFVVDYYYMTQVSVQMAGLASVMVLLVSIRSMKAGIREGRYYMSACALFIAGIVVQLFRSYGLVSASFPVSYMYLAGMGLMMFMLSLGVADKIGKLRGEREKALDGLKESEERYRALVENAHDGIILLHIAKTREGELSVVVEYVNPSLLRMLGFTAVEFYSKGLDICLADTPMGKDLIKGRLKKRLQGDEIPITFEGELQRKNGEIISVVISSSSFTLGSSQRVLSIVTDVTFLKKAEKTIRDQFQEIRSQYEEMEALNEELVSTQNELIEMNDTLIREKEQIAATLRSIADGVITTDVNGCVTLMNSAAESLCGCSQDNGLGKPVGDVFTFRGGTALSGKADPLMDIFIRGGLIITDAPVMYVTPDGSEKVIEMNAAPITALDRIIGAVLVLRDITERYRNQKELNKIGKLESLGMLAGGIAHDFNNLLTAIIGNLSLAREYMSADPECRESIESIESAAQRAVALTRQLLTFSKGGQPVKQSASITDLLRENVTFLLRGSTIRAEFSFSDGILPVDVDTDQISQVIHNIVINAVQSMPCGGVLSVGARTVDGRDNPVLAGGRYVEITMRDTGAGIPRRVMGRIFDPYFTTKSGGSGLGLSICYSIVKKHGGYIDVESEEGRGTLFRIYLRASENDVEKVEQQEKTVRRMSGRILLMDDESYIQEAGRRMLSYLGYDTVCVSDGDAAIKAYIRAREEGKPFSAVIMDLTIPGGMGGLETIKRLKDIDPSVVAIVSSGYSNDPVMAHYGEYGFSGIIMKPYTVHELMKILGDIFE